MSITSTREDWLIDAAKLDGKEVLFISNRRDLSQEMALAALDAQYGVGVFDAWHHGTSLRISKRLLSRSAATYKRFSEANERIYDARREGLPEDEIQRRREVAAQARKIWDAKLATLISEIKDKESKP